MSISTLRQNFLNQLQQLPSEKIRLSGKEALAEYQTELDRVDSIRNLDGNPGDLDPREDFVKFSHPGHSLGLPVEGWGYASETTFANQEKPVLDYFKTESVFLGPALVAPAINDAGQPAQPAGPTFETLVHGSNDRNTNTWTARRLSEGPAGIRYEEVHINYADPANSSKEVWLYSAPATTR
jgi:hypothetical protein